MKKNIFKAKTLMLHANLQKCVGSISVKLWLVFVNNGFW